MPTRGADEPRDDFLSRCMSDSKMVDEFGNSDQRYAVCVSYADKSSSASDTNMASDEDVSVEAEMEYCDSCSSQDKCAETGQCNAQAAEPSPSSEETHQEYMTRCMEMGYTEQQCMLAHEGHEFAAEKDDDEYVSVTIDLEVGEIQAVLEASTGNTLMEITGIAFHEGFNKNGWSLTREAAEKVLEQMVGADVTLNHPKAREQGAGFTRNMDGGVDEAVVGVVKHASIHDLPEGKWEVRYVAHVVRTELFNALESGLWNRENYGVSIGGTGIPVSSSEDGIVFGPRFSFDHLAIVHKPAYPRANIESVKRITPETEPIMAGEILKYDSALDEGHQQVIANMTDDVSNNFEADIEAQASEIESLKADLVMANARVNEFMAEKEARAEEIRSGLVSEAGELGMSGHEDLSADTLSSLIASWREAHPEPVPVEMAPVAEPQVASEQPAVASAQPQSVVANYLNGSLLETSEDAYARAWNAWASAWNRTLAVAEKDRMSAPNFTEMKEMI